MGAELAGEGMCGSGFPLPRGQEGAGEERSVALTQLADDQLLSPDHNK